MLIASPTRNEAPRLGLSQLLEIERLRRGGKSSSHFPAIKGIVTYRTRELPFCDCGARLRWDADLQYYVCDDCRRPDEYFPVWPRVPGRVTLERTEENLVNYLELMQWWFNSDSTRLDASKYIAISNDGRPAHELRSHLLSLYADGAWSSAISASKNFTSKIWTYTYTFTAPTAPGRTIRFVALGVAGGVHYSYCRQFLLLSGTPLTSEVYQSDVETFEVVYKYQFVEA